MSRTKAAQPVQVSPATLVRYVGTYETDGQYASKKVIDVTVDGANLWFDYGGKGKELLVPLSPTRFSWYGSVVEFSTQAGSGMNVALHYAEGTERGTRRK
jgi:hypothetical protein